MGEAEGHHHLPRQHRAGHVEVALLAEVLADRRAEPPAQRVVVRARRPVGPPDTALRLERIVRRLGVVVVGVGGVAEERVAEAVERRADVVSRLGRGDERVEHDAAAPRARAQREGGAVQLLGVRTAAPAPWGGPHERRRQGRRGGGDEAAAAVAVARRRRRLRDEPALAGGGSDDLRLARRLSRRLFLLLLLRRVVGFRRVGGPALRRRGGGPGRGAGPWLGGGTGRRGGPGWRGGPGRRAVRRRRGGAVRHRGGDVEAQRHAVEGERHRRVGPVVAVAEPAAREEEVDDGAHRVGPVGQRAVQQPEAARRGTRGSGESGESGVWESGRGECGWQSARAEPTLQNWLARGGDWDWEGASGGFERLPRDALEKQRVAGTERWRNGLSPVRGGSRRRRRRPPRARVTVTGRRLGGRPSLAMVRARPESRALRRESELV